MQKALGNRDDGLSIYELEEVLKLLVKKVNAKKKLYVRYRGVVTETIEVPDHRVQLRALNELAKLYALYPTRGEPQRAGLNDCSERPVINLVMPSLDE